MSPEPPTAKLSAKEAAQRASAYLRELIGVIWDTRLEEVEMDDDEQFWLITLSYAEGPGFARSYKVFKIDAHDGDVVSMKIREA